MAIQINSVIKREHDKWDVSVRDTADVIGQNESGADIYRTYRATYYPSKGMADLKKRIEDQISALKKIKSDAMQIETDIKTTVESIDVTKLEAP